jgi:hypothetical protein
LKWAVMASRIGVYCDRGDSSCTRVNRECVLKKKSEEEDREEDERER